MVVTLVALRGASLYFGYERKHSLLDYALASRRTVAVASTNVIPRRSLRLQSSVDRRPQLAASYFAGRSRLGCGAAFTKLE